METNNYRPISFLPILCKRLECYVHTEYYVTNNLLTTGSRRLHSTVTYLLHVTDQWLKNIDEGLVTGVVFIDLWKAFDIVVVDILLAKLTSFAIGGVEHQWFQGYLSGRSQSLSVNSHLSDSLPVSMGVPQCSLLGPLLYLLFLHDVHSVVESCETNMFADDTEIDTAEKPQCDEDF